MTGHGLVHGHVGGPVHVRILDTLTPWLDSELIKHPLTVLNYVPEMN